MFVLIIVFIQDPFKSVQYDQNDLNIWIKESRNFCVEIAYMNAQTTRWMYKSNIHLFRLLIKVQNNIAMRYNNFVCNEWRHIDLFKRRRSKTSFLFPRLFYYSYANPRTITLSNKVVPREKSVCNKAM